MRGPASALAALLLAGAGCAGGAGAPPPAPPDPCARAAPGAPWLVFSTRVDGTYDLATMRADGTCRAPLTAGAGDDLYPSWSVGDRIAFASDRDGAARIWSLDLATGVEAPVEVGDLAATSPAWSPDGTRLAFEGRAPDALQTDVFVVAAVGGAPAPVAASARDDAGPAWSPDGATLYFVSSRTGRYEIFSVPVAGGDPVQLTTGSRIIGKPAVAPAGDALFFARTVSGASTAEIVRLDLATSSTQVVSSEDDSEPAVDPSGGRIALRSFRGASADLWIVGSADGGAPLALTSDDASDGAPAFAPAP